MPRMNDGVDYFPLDVNTDGDQKFQILEAKFGVVGFGIVVKLYQSIYRNSYYCEWNDLIAVISASKWSSADFQITESYAQKVVRKAAEYGIFSKEMLNKYGILTSKGIQKRYFEASKRRLKINVKKEYLLVNAPANAVNVDIKGVNVNINPENVCRKTQSKVEKSKVEYRESTRTRATHPSKEQIRDYAKAERLVISPDKFFEYYSARNWNGVPDWKAKMREWNATERKRETGDQYAAYDIDLFEKTLNTKD